MAKPPARAVDFPHDDPLAVLPGESLRANDALRRYVRLGPRRTLAAVGKDLGHTSVRHLEFWSARWGWQERLAAWMELEGRAADRALRELRQTISLETLERLQEVEKKALAEWERSRGRQTSRTETASVEAGGGGEGEGGAGKRPKRGSVTVKSEEGLGDPRYLQIVLAARRDMRELLGLDAPKKAEITGRVEVDVEVALARRLAAVSTARRRGSRRASSGCRRGRRRSRA